MAFFLSPPTIGNDLFNQNNKLTPSPISSTFYQSPPPLSLPSPPMALPLQYHRPPSSNMLTSMILPRKRPAPSPAMDGFRRNYSAMAAAAAAAEDALDGEEDDGESEGEETEGSEDVSVEVRMRRLTKAIERFGEIYEKVEGMKQRQMVELEKQRMQFAKDLEAQRMQLLMDTQVHVVKMKQAKQFGSFEDV